MKDAPAFDFYPERWIAGTRHMSKAERCDYLDLLSIQWLEDGLPDDLKRIASILRYRNPDSIPKNVLEKFPVAEDGRRRNPRLEIERVKQRERIAQRRLGAQITNAKRALSDRSATFERGDSVTPPPTTHPRRLIKLPRGRTRAQRRRRGPMRTR